MAKYILLILLLMSGMIPTWAQTVVADDIEQLQKQMYQLYNKNDETAFVDITNKLKDAAQKAGDERTFYKAWANQALYFANHQQRNRGQLAAKDMQQYALDHDHKFGIYTGTHVMGTIQTMMGDYQEGIQNFRKAISYLHQHFPSESAAASWIEMARISLTNRNCQQACLDAEQALKEPNISAMHRLNAWSVICLSKVDTAYYHVKDADEYQKEFAAYLGLIPTSHSSGDKVAHGKMTFRGNKQLGPMIIETAWISICKDAGLGSLYLRYKERMKPQEAIVRIARKLSNIIFAVLKNETQYIPYIMYK